MLTVGGMAGVVEEIVMERFVKEAKGGGGEILCAEQGFAMDGCSQLWMEDCYEMQMVGWDI